MLDVSFDSLWQRNLRQKRKRIAIASVCYVLALIAAYLFAMPVSVSVSVNMQKADLPIGEIVTLFVDGGEYTSNSMNPYFTPISIPGYKRFSDICISVSSEFDVPVDTMLFVGFGTIRDVQIELKRDNTFAIFAGNVYQSDMNPLPEVAVTVSGHTSVTDNEGYFTIILPLAEQREELPISLECHGYIPYIRENETPG